MKRASAAAVVAHSGGPTAVLNASLLGVVEEAARHEQLGALYGARFGMDGILAGDFVELSRVGEWKLRSIARAPSSALGTSRREMGTAELECVLDVFRKREIRYFFYNGGNGSMGTALELDGMARRVGYELQVIGIPKTIDNDLLETDHTPGYGSAARFFACAVRDIDADNRALPGQVEIVEVLGRNAGWLVAATALARRRAEDGPHLIYFPEERLALAKLLGDVEAVYRRWKRCVVAVCEGQLDENGEPFGADVRAGSRGSLAMNVGHRLAMLVMQHLGLRARSEKPGLLGRSSSAFVSETDWREARACGEAAVRAAISGASGQMVTLRRERGESYAVQTGLVGLERVAYLERPFPEEWRSTEMLEGGGAFAAWAAPLVGDVPPHESF